MTVAIMIPVRQLKMDQVLFHDQDLNARVTQPDIQRVAAAVQYRQRATNRYVVSNRTVDVIQVKAVDIGPLNTSTTSIM